MGFWSSLKSVAASVGNAVVKGVVKTVDCTLQVCQAVATVTADACRKTRDKIREWTTPKTPKDPVPPTVKRADEPLVENSIGAIKEHFPAGVVETATNSNPEDRKKKIEELVPIASRAMGIKTPPTLDFFVPDSIEQMTSLCGGYRHRDNTLRLNLAMIVSDEPELFREQVSTIFHELVHARQHEAVSALANGKPYEEYGYSVEDLQVMANNFLNYITPGENYEAYTKQPVEAEAYWFEEQIKPSFN